MKTTKHKLFHLITILITIAVISSSFHSQPQTPQHSRIEMTLGSPLYHLLLASEEVTLVKIKPTLQLLRGSPPEMLGMPVTLSPEQKDELFGLLFNDASYHFEATKKNLFLAQYLLTFHTPSGEITLLLNHADRQVKFPNTTLDYDPNGKRFNTLINKIFIS